MAGLDPPIRATTWHLRVWMPGSRPGWPSVPMAG